MGRDNKYSILGISQDTHHHHLAHRLHPSSSLHPSTSSSSSSHHHHIIIITTSSSSQHHHSIIITSSHQHHHIIIRSSSSSHHHHVTHAHRFPTPLDKTGYQTLSKRLLSWHPSPSLSTSTVFLTRPSTHSPPLPAALPHVILPSTFNVGSWLNYVPRLTLLVDRFFAVQYCYEEVRWPVCDSCSFPLRI